MRIRDWSSDVCSSDLHSAAETAARWLGAAERALTGGSEAQWTVSAVEGGGYTLERRWRGVSDHHAIDAAFLASQEARRLHKLSAEQAETYASPARLVKATGAAAVEVETAEEDAEGEAPAASSANANPLTRPRSEEHPSEPQTLMRIPYASI